MNKEVNAKTNRQNVLGVLTFEQSNKQMKHVQQKGEDDGDKRRRRREKNYENFSTQ